MPHFNSIEPDQAWMSQAFLTQLSHIMNSADLVRKIKSAASFVAIANKIRKRKGYRAPQTFGLGLAHISMTGKVLSVRFPHVNGPGEDPDTAAIFQEEACVTGTRVGDDGDVSIASELDPHSVESLTIAYRPMRGNGKAYYANMEAFDIVDMMRQTEQLDGKLVPVFVFIYDLSKPPTSTADLYLRLHLISLGKMGALRVSDQGAHDLLTDCVWTYEYGPIEATRFDEIHREYMLKHGRTLNVKALGRFPLLTDFVVPPKVWLTNVASVRLGTYLPPGTCVIDQKPDTRLVESMAG